jgi:hypothetical protein
MATLFRRNHQMHKILTFGIAAVLAIVAVATWATATTHSNDHVKASAAFGSPINPLEFMKSSKDLPHQQYDTH